MTHEIVKNDTKFAEKIKNNWLPVDLDFALRDFFVGIGVLHECTDFYTCTWNVARGALRWKCIGGAIEPFCHTHFWNIYQMSIFASSEVCAKFRDFSSMFRPSKMRLGLEKKNKNNNNNNNNNRADSIGSSHHRCSVPN